MPNKNRRHDGVLFWQAVHRNGFAPAPLPQALLAQPSREERNSQSRRNTAVNAVERAELEKADLPHTPLGEELLELFAVRAATAEHQHLRRSCPDELKNILDVARRVEHQLFLENRRARQPRMRDRARDEGAFKIVGE